MTAAAETGRAGERAATEYLRRAGYEICALNWRQGRYELDIVACREGVLHFVEVKTRRSGSLTPPEAAATQRKFRALSRAAACYLRTVGWEGEVQFDLAAAEAAADEGILNFDLLGRQAEGHRDLVQRGNFAVPTNCTIFAGLKKNSLTSGHRARALETENSTP